MTASVLLNHGGSLEVREKNFLVRVNNLLLEVQRADTRPAARR